MARKRELEVAQLEGKLVSVETTQATWAAIIATARQRLLSIPAKLGPRVAGLDAAEASELLRRDIHEALHELAKEDLKGAAP